MPDLSDQVRGGGLDRLSQWDVACWVHTDLFSAIVLRNVALKEQKNWWHLYSFVHVENILQRDTR